MTGSPSTSRDAAVRAVADVLAPAFSAGERTFFARVLAGIHARRGAAGRGRIERNIASWLAWPMSMSDADRARAAELTGRIFAALDQPAPLGSGEEHGGDHGIDAGESGAGLAHGDQTMRTAAGAGEGQS